MTVQDSKGVMVAHGTNAGLIGKTVLDLKDVDGKPFNRDTQAIKDAGWINFKWQNPTTKAVEAKTAIYRSCRRLSRWRRCLCEVTTAP